LPQNGLLEINVKDLQQNAVPDEKGHLLSGTSGIFSISGSHGTQSKLTFGKLIYSTDQSDYVGLPPNSCDFVIGIDLSFAFSGEVNPFPVMADWNWSLSGDEVQPAYDTVVNVNYVTISNNGSGDMATVNFANAVPGQSLFLNGPTTNATICDACSAGDISPQGSQLMPVMPRILFGTSQTDITGTTQTVVVGQQIALTASYKLPSGSTVSSQSWSVPGTTVGGFSATIPNAGLTPTNFNQQSTTFYWVMSPGSTQTVTYTLNYKDNTGHNQNATATAKFTINGPTSVSVSIPSLGQWQIQSSTSGTELDFGFPIGTPGITFNAKATSPSQATGTYLWAQIITTNSNSQTSGSTTTTCSTGTGLDNKFPGSTGLTFSDSPSLILQSVNNKQTWSLGFTTYFMWRPGLTNDIPVPLGNATWTAFGDAAVVGGAWTKQADSSASNTSFQLSASYPTWSNVVVNGVSKCQ
jgi:hypothetical protein